MEDTTTQAPLAMRVVGGGEPTDEELAAILVALTPADGGGGDDASRVPAWTRAAVLEGIGGRPSASPTDLDTALPLA